MQSVWKAVHHSIPELKTYCRKLGRSGHIYSSSLRKGFFIWFGIRPTI
ncbi:MAG: hypothetical protein H0W62_09855 [Chitinophagales bacterium]|nr:hypothetical protein [Chitinophagales bacterium]